MAELAWDLARSAIMESGRTPARTLSFVVPVFNVEAYLSECIESILSYEGDDIEVVAIDDCSPDACPAILDDYARVDNRVRVVHLSANVGLGQARNAGIDHAMGDYIWFVDSDDWLPAGAVRALIDRLRLASPDVLVINHAEVFEDGAEVKSMLADILAGLSGPLRLSQRPQLLRLAQSACTKIVRRGLLLDNDLRFAPGWYEDSYFSHVLLMTANRIDALEHVCYCYRQRTPGSITTTLSDRHFEVFGQYARLYARVERAGGELDAFRPELFRLMINHYLVIAGNQWRLPAHLRQSFFRRIADEYERRLPPDGYPIPPGMEGVKHRLVRRRAYAVYATLRFAYALISRVRPRRQTRDGRRPSSEFQPDRRWHPAERLSPPPTVVAPRQRSNEHQSY
jgi:CDP-glycerol glycerophosphotransferase